MFRDRYRKEMDRLSPQPERLQELSGQMEKIASSKKAGHRYGWKRPVATAALFAVICAGVLAAPYYLPDRQGGGVSTANQFSIVAYASGNSQDKTAISSDAKLVFPSGSIKRGGKLVTYTDENGEQKSIYNDTVFEQQGGLCVMGENILSVTYTSESGELHYFDAAMFESMRRNGQLKTKEVPSDDGTVLVELEETEEPPYFRTGKTVTATYSPEIGQDSLNVDWFLPEALEIASSNIPLQYEDLPSDTITVTVTFTDGQTMTKTIQISFQEDGSFLGELLDNDTKGE